MREVCKANGVTEHTFCVWRKKYGGMQTDDIRRLRELEAENAALRRIVANQALEIEPTRTVLRKNGHWGATVKRSPGFQEARGA